MSPRDESAGPLFVEYLYNAGEINQKMFSITPGKQKPLITFGGYEKSQSLVAHRISGSFHWEIDLKRIKIGQFSIRPSLPFALTDTGTNMVLIYKNDLIKILTSICVLLETLETTAYCEEAGYGYYLIKHFSPEVQKIMPSIVF